MMSTIPVRPLSLSMLPGSTATSFFVAIWNLLVAVGCAFPTMHACGRFDLALMAFEGRPDRQTGARPPAAPVDQETPLRRVSICGRVMRHMEWKRGPQGTEVRHELERCESRQWTSTEACRHGPVQSIGVDHHRMAGRLL